MDKQGIHYANLKSSPRLKRLHSLLSTGKPYTTAEIIYGASICAVNTAICELRENGFNISCKRISQGIYEYQMAGDQSC